MASILVVDDEQSMREFLEILLRKEGHEVTTEADTAAAIARVQSTSFDLVITDLKLGRGSGLDVLRAVKSATPTAEVVMVTAFATAENAVLAMKLGAHDYVLKPFKVDELKHVVSKALEHRALLAENRVLRHRAGAASVEHELLGVSPPIQRVRELIGKVAPARTTILITGESGTGKEVVARTIHARGERSAEPFIAINCGAIPEGLIESELFGHEKGSFTGATGAKAGLFEVAGSGTLFLDEIGELPAHVQVKLLRALQERKIRRVGGSADIPVAARIIAATNRDLAEEVASGAFREDLYYRLDVIRIHMPPLRERRDDIPVFVDHFAAKFAADLGRAVPRFTEGARSALLAYRYPGNLRELANVIERSVTLADGDEIGPELLPTSVRGPDSSAVTFAASLGLPPRGIDLQGELDAIERRLLEEALARCGGVKTDAARLLGLTFRSLRYRLAKFGIDGL